MEGCGRSRRRRGDGCAVVECYTPTRVVTRWLRSFKGKREAEEEQNKDMAEGYHLPHIKCSTKRLNEETHRFESQSREASLEMGIGSLLLYLVIASKAELDKMANLRMQMEMFLLNAKEELQKKELQESLHMSSNNASAIGPSGFSFSPQIISNLASSIFEGSSASVFQEENTECEVSKPEDYYNQQTDRDSKLQADVGEEKAEERPKRQHKLKDNEDTTKNHLPEMVTDETYGVCPYELEKRLHEVLEARQQEELLKLQNALTRVERRLQEKETEVSWWKDAARLLAQRVPETSRDGLEWRNLEPSVTRFQQSVPRTVKAFSKNRISFSR